MKIDGMRLTLASMPMVDPQWRTASYASPVINSLILELWADGVSGLGGVVARARGLSGDELSRQIEGPVRQLLVGQDAWAHTAICEALRAAGMHRSAIAAVDMALYDLLGKAAGLPCHALWGGAVRRSVRVVRMVGIKEPSDLVTAVGRMVDAGFSAFKIKLGTGVDADVARIRAVREALDVGLWLSVDGNGVYSVEDALALCRQLEPFNVQAVEQPIAYTDLDGLARLTAASPVPIMADQVVSGLDSALELCKRRAAHVVSIKPGQTGTIDECRNVAAMCLAAGIRVHVGGSGHPAVVDAAHAHLAVSLPGIDEECEVGGSLEVRDDPTIGVVVRDGRHVVGDAPGLGISWAPGFGD